MAAQTLHGRLSLSIYELIDIHVPGDYAYITAWLGVRRVMKTALAGIAEGRAEWGLQNMTMDVNDPVQQLVFKLKVGRGNKKADPIGIFSLNIIDLVGHSLSSESVFPFFTSAVKPGNINGDVIGRVRLLVHYIPLSMVPHEMEVPNCNFPLRSGCKVTLYQDAHVLNDELPTIHNGHGNPWHHRRAFEEIYAAIANARHLIYIAGWSFYPHLELMRENPVTVNADGSVSKASTLGELLKQKAQQSCRVCLMIWDDFSNNVTGGGGLMRTYDELTKTYFRATGVSVAKVMRRDDREGGTFGGMMINSTFTHHQKIVIVDAPAPTSAVKRRLIAFLGGLDLTIGRWDTPSHCIFGTLNTYHSGDFYQACVETDQKTGPREPWHDTHCCLEGDVTWDILRNFENRWREQGKKDVPLYPITEHEFVRRADEAAFLANDPERWKVQMFRSIDARSVVFDRSVGLFLKKGRLVDTSVQTAYVHHIRRAQRFVYIENQYFLGSSHMWSGKTSKSCTNLIALELASKIVAMIQARKRFAVYVLMPMFPDGLPGSFQVQEILFWQHKTVQMMYAKIATALQDMNLLHTHHPMDYLMFMCVGRKEVDTRDTSTVSPPRRSSCEEGRSSIHSVLREQRFPIYVHSKCMIIDDEYVVVGSANINERSMCGTRDTEIAIGAFQPMHTTEYLQQYRQVPRGDVYCFRKSLWSEHFGSFTPPMEYPEQLECVRRQQQLLRANWDAFSAHSPHAPMYGHAMAYPYIISPYGEVTSLTECFPDTNAPILGKLSKFGMNLLTT